jgi:hypothetical protein
VCFGVVLLKDGRAVAEMPLDEWLELGAVSYAVEEARQEPDKTAT